MAGAQRKRLSSGSLRMESGVPLQALVGLFTGVPPERGPSDSDEIWRAPPLNKSPGLFIEKRGTGDPK